VPSAKIEKYSNLAIIPTNNNDKIHLDTQLQQILDGKGINDCTCGLSKKMPSCDGSHKALR
jgi:CDGSH-type Zn-finger protein